MSAAWNGFSTLQRDMLCCTHIIGRVECCQRCLFGRAADRSIGCGQPDLRELAQRESVSFEVTEPAAIEGRKRLADTVIKELSGDTLKQLMLKRVPNASTMLLDALRVGELTEIRPANGGVKTTVYLSCNFDPTLKSFSDAPDKEDATVRRAVLSACKDEAQRALKAAAKGPDK
jgi:hypothetical protein